MVGVQPGDIRHVFRWTQQLVIRNDATLKLYAYRWPVRDRGPVLKEVAADRVGRFDFGEVPAGHYTLVISVPWGDDSFDVQITRMKNATDSVTIDISPVSADCTGDTNSSYLPSEFVWGALCSKPVNTQ